MQLVWRVKLVAELRPGVMMGTEVARIERDEHAGLADLGLRLAETKRVIAALQAGVGTMQIGISQVGTAQAGRRPGRHALNSRHAGICPIPNWTDQRS